MRPSKVTIIAADYPELEKYCPNWQGMKAGMERLGIPYQFISCRPTLDVGAVVAYGADLVIYALRDMVLHPEWRHEIREALPNAKIVMWYGDLRSDETGQYDADCSEMDAMFVSNDAQEKYYKSKWRMKAVHYLPLGCEPLKQPKLSKMFNFDFVFIGGQISEGMFRGRAETIETLKVRGNLKVVNSFEPKMRARIYQEMPAIYSSSKVCLDVSHFTYIKGYTSIRFFEIPAMFGFALTKRFPGCEELYPEGTRVYFDTFDEAIKLKDYYLTHDKERAAIVAKGHEWSYNHTYDKRFEKMFSLL
jgi:spore maturation protein CgeB